MKPTVLVACEFSGVVRDAFRRRGFEAWSCDLYDVEPEGEYPNYHIFGDVLDFLDGSAGPVRRWDLMIAFPPCTYICRSGARWWNDPRFPGRIEQRERAVNFVRSLWSAPINRIAIENPIGILSTRIGKPTQIVQPWMFGHGETKATRLWLKNLPCLVPIKAVEGRENRIHRMSPSKGRSRERSRTYSGLAEAMGEQWGAVLDHGESPDAPRHRSPK